jgi:hypothetical protein
MTDMHNNVNRVNEKKTETFKKQLCYNCRSCFLGFAPESRIKINPAKFHRASSPITHRLVTPFHSFPFILLAIFQENAGNSKPG